MARLDYPEEVKTLIDQLKKLPGVGPKGAERIAVWLLAQDKAFADDLAKATLSSTQVVDSCEICGFFRSLTKGCALCNDSGRDGSVICVVEQPTDVIPLEKSGGYSGKYHCLGGKIAPLENIGPEDLRIGILISRIKEEEFEEVILGVGSDVEGEATANFLAELIVESGFTVEITRLAQGLPAGGGLENADELTLYRALEGRRKV